MQDPLSDAELDRAKHQIKGQIGIACDSRENFALDFGKSFLHFGWEKDITSLYAQIDAVTATGIQNVANDLFVNDKTYDTYLQINRPVLAFVNSYSLYPKQVSNGCCIASYYLYRQ